MVSKPTRGYPRTSALSPAPVVWDAGRDARGAAPDRGLYRCPVRGCPVVSASLRVMVSHARRHLDEDGPATGTLSRWGSQHCARPWDEPDDEEP